MSDNLDKWVNSDDIILPVASTASQLVSLCHQVMAEMRHGSTQLHTKMGRNFCDGGSSIPSSLQPEYNPLSGTNTLVNQDIMTLQSGIDYILIHYETLDEHVD